jgi:hypothetical protein
MIFTKLIPAAVVMQSMSLSVEQARAVRDSNVRDEACKLEDGWGS